MTELNMTEFCRTPDPDPAAHRPVMVWIYGGVYKLGDAASYDGSRIARDGEVAVVSSTTGWASKVSPASRDDMHVCEPSSAP